MQRCIQLAKLGSGNVAPNPMVGSVLVYNDKIIGEGYHKQYGGAHAEVDCIASVNEKHHTLIASSTLYVSLEPCAHWGKTPPCADLIIEKKIPKVVIGCRDSFVQVDGKGIEKLRSAAVEVQVGILENECKELNKRFFTFQQKQRPYIILKWAQTLDNKISGGNGARLLISAEQANRLVHKWRSVEAGIVIGTNTALLDNPQLSTRLWPGKSPVRIVVDSNLRLPSSLQVFDGSNPTIIFNRHRHTLAERIEIKDLVGVHYYQLTKGDTLVQQMLNGLYRLNIQSILVEGGAQLLQSLIEEGLWDEARVIYNEQSVIGKGLQAPQLSNHQLRKSQTLLTDKINFYQQAGH